MTDKAKKRKNNYLCFRRVVGCRLGDVSGRGCSCGNDISDKNNYYSAWLVCGQPGIVHFPIYKERGGMDEEV